MVTTTGIGGRSQYATDMFELLTIIDRLAQYAAVAAKPPSAVIPRPIVLPRLVRGLTLEAIFGHFRFP